MVDIPGFITARQDERRRQRRARYRREKFLRPWLQRQSASVTLVAYLGLAAAAALAAVAR